VELKHEMMMVGDGDEMKELFTLFIQWHLESSRVTQNYFFVFAFAFGLFLLLAHFALKIGEP
jgi:hypothetical protein